jgi:hypothetical protein
MEKLFGKNNIVVAGSGILYSETSGLWNNRNVGR